jgi:hypothetical protein
VLGQFRKIAGIMVQSRKITACRFVPLVSVG